MRRQHQIDIGCAQRETSPMMPALFADGDGAAPAQRFFRAIATARDGTAPPVR